MFDDFNHIPASTYPEPRSPEEVRELLGLTDSKHSADAL